MRRALRGRGVAAIISQKGSLRSSRSGFCRRGSLNVPYAALGPISVHFPARVETNQQLAEEFPDWNVPLIYSKTGIAQRYVAAPG